MKQISLISVLIVILAFPACIFAEQDVVEVFFIPEQGFIRVNARISVPAEQDQIQFKLFPKAHVTALWIPTLLTYEVNNTTAAAVVSAVFQPDSAAQTLDLSYEGFLPNYESEPMQALDETLMWYPLFESQPNRDYRIKLSLSRDYLPKLDGKLLDVRESAFATYTWLVENQGYPVIWFGDQEDTPEDELDAVDEGTPADESEPDETPEPDEEPEHPDTPDPTDEPDPSDATEHTSELGDELKQDSPDTSEDKEPEPLEPAEAEDLEDGQGLDWMQDLVESTDEELINEAVTEFVRAISLSSRDDLNALIHPDFTDREQFIAYLISRPHDSTITNQVVEIRPTESGSIVYCDLYENDLLTSKVYSLWQNSATNWFLVEWSQIPAEYEFDLRIGNSELQRWLDDFRTAVTEFDLVWLDYHITHNKLQAVKLLQAIRSEIEWIASAVSTSDDQAVFMIKTQFSARLKLTLNLYPDSETWKISAIAAEPVY